MWLDRFSAHSTPSGTPPYNRSNSPSQRSRPTHLSPGNQPSRPGYSPRSSSLSLAVTPNDSTASLPGTLRANGSTLRHARSRSPAPDVADPLEVLNGIIGKPGDIERIRVPSEKQSAFQKPDQLVESIDFGNLSLEEFLESGSGNTGNKQDAGIHETDQLEQERDKFQELHNAIIGCDDVLKTVESYLASFQSELGSVSAEIETLQSRSVQLNSQLENRKNVERLLGPAVEEISISPKAIKLIAEGPIDETWISALNEIETRSKNVEAKALGSSTIKALEDARPLLTELKNKAIERIRDYLVAQIKALRSPNINAQILQQQRLVKFKDLFGFLSRNHQTLSQEISQAYINTMRWYYQSNFVRYTQALDKIKLHTIDRSEVLGGDPTSQRGNFLPGGRSPTVSYDPFALGRRIDILRTSNNMAITSYLAEEDKSVHCIEVPFRNFNLVLVDNISAEYSFLTEFFSVLPFSQISRKVVEIFEPVFALGQSLTKQLIEGTTDCLGVLLCVRLNQQSAFELQRRKIPVAESYINGINMALWPRFQMIMDLHCESVKAAASASGKGSGSAFSLSADDSSKLSSVPHPLTQRFGQMLHGILALSTDAGDDEPVSNSLNRLRTEFDVLLAKYASSTGDATKSRFLFNNYSLILTIIGDTHGKLADNQKEHFESLLKSCGGKR